MKQLTVREETGVVEAAVTPDTIAFELEVLGMQYQDEVRRSERFRQMYQGSSDECDGLREQVRKALKRIKLLEKEIERLSNEGSSQVP